MKAAQVVRVSAETLLVIDRPWRPWHPGKTGEVAGFAVLYLGAVLVGRRFVDPTVDFATIWPATGIGVGALVTTGVTRRRAMAGAVLFTTLLGNLLTGSGWLLAVGFAIVNTTAAFAAALALTAGGRSVLDNFRRLWPVLVSAVVGGMLGGLLGTGMLLLVQGVAHPFQAAGMWLAADAISVVVFAPLVIAFRVPEPFLGWKRAARSVLVSVGLFTATITIVLADQLSGHSLLYPTIAIAMLGALVVRGRMLIVTLGATFLVLAELRVRGLGPFSGGSITDVLAFHAYVGVLTVSSLAVAAIQRRNDRLANQLAQTVQSASSVVLLIDDGRVALANPAAEALMGAEVVGRPMSALWPVELTEQALESRSGLEVELNDPDGRPVPLEITVDPVPLESGHGLVIVARDLSERMAMETERRRLLDIIASLPDFVGFARPDGTIAYLSPGAREMTGFGNRSVDDAAVGSLAPRWAAELIREEAIPHAAEHGVWRGESAYLGPDGHEIPVAQVVMAHRNDRGELEMFSTVAHDLRDRVEMEQERQSLIDNVVHDLRNTMSAIAGATEMLETDVDAAAADARLDRTLIRILSGGVSQLHNLIEDLTATRDMTSLASLELERLDLAALARQVVSLHVIAASRQSVSIAVEGDGVWVSADRGQLHRLIENLVSNAVKFSPGGGTVRLAVRAEQPRAVLTVTDEGMGIDPAELENVFLRRHRSDAVRAAGIAGSGLGLAICKQIAEAHGGAIEALSGRGVGSTFRVELPLIQADRSFQASI